MIKKQSDFQDEQAVLKQFTDVLRFDLTRNLKQQIDEDESEGNKNVFQNMKKLSNTHYFPNSNQLKKQVIPDFEPRSNDLGSRQASNSLSHQQSYIKRHSSNLSRSKQTGNEFEGKNMQNLQENSKIKPQHQPSLKRMAEENIEDNDFSSSEFDVSENEAVGTQRSINSSSFFNVQRKGLFNQKIKEFNERKGRCNTLLPKQAQKYFRDHKPAKSYVGGDPINPEVQFYKNSRQDDLENSFERFQENFLCSYYEIQDNNQQPLELTAEQREELFQQYLEQKSQNKEIMNSRKNNSANQIAQAFPESVLASAKFNYNFSSQQRPVGDAQNLAKKQALKIQAFSQPSSPRQEVLTPLFAAPSTKASAGQLIFEDSSKESSTQGFIFPAQQSKDNTQLQMRGTSSSFQKSSTIIAEQDPTDYGRTSHATTLSYPVQPLAGRAQQIYTPQQQAKDIQSSNCRQSQSFDMETCNVAPTRYVPIHTLNNNSHYDSQQMVSRLSQIEFQNDYQSLKTHQNDNISLRIPQNDNISAKLPIADNYSSKFQQNNDIQSLKALQTDIQSLQMRKLSANYTNGQLITDQQSQNNTRKTKKSLLQSYNEHDFLVFPENEQLVGTINTIDVRIDTQTVRTAKFIDKKEQSRIIDQEIYNSLIKAIFQFTPAIVQAILKRILNEERYHLINQVDDKGNTPLLLAVKLAHQNDNIFAIVKMLLKCDADPRIRDRQDWSCFEEVASQKDYQLAGIIFDSLISFKKKTLLTQKRQIDNMLSEVPDFYLEMKWEFESNLIPFVSKFAPSDTFKIWKYGRSVRCDSTYAGLQKYRAKRRAQSLIFNCLNLNNIDTDVATDYDFLTVLHKEEKTYHFPLQELDAEEKKKIIQDLLGSAENLQGNLKIENSSIAQSKSFFGQKSAVKVQGYLCEKYDLQLKYRYQIFKKTRVPFSMSYESYVSSNLTDISPTKTINSPQDVSQSSENRQKESMLSQSLNTTLKEIKINGIDNPNPFDIQITETGKNEIKKQTLGLYVSEEFPMKFKAFMPLLQFLSNGNQLLTNLHEVFNDHKVSEIVKTGFPVKVQVPLSYSIYANITFSSYKQKE